MVQDIPIQPVENPILCNPSNEPTDHWVYDPLTGVPTVAGIAPPAGYWYKTERTGTAQQISLLTEEERDDLPLVNALRDDVRRWREADYRGASQCHSRAAAILGARRPAPAAILLPARGGRDDHLPCRTALSWPVSRTGFQRFAVTDDDLKKLLAGERPSGALGGTT